jgi:hypothetical protein
MRPWLLEELEHDSLLGQNLGDCRGHFNGIQCVSVELQPILSLKRLAQPVN